MYKQDEASSLSVVNHLGHMGDIYILSPALPYDKILKHKMESEYIAVFNLQSGIHSQVIHV